jgi:hypothetical protein
MTNKTTEFIEKAIKIHGDRYDYSKVEYIKASQKVIIICKEHGEFTLTPNKHLSRKDGCKKCSRKIISNKQRSTTESFINKAKEIHGDKYDYSKVEYYNSKTYITIVCKKHEEFTQQPSNHLTGYGCKKCRDEKSGNTQRLSLNIFINKAKDIHGDKYDYSKVEYINSHLNIQIICKIHGIFYQKPNNHLNGATCLLCSNINSSQKQRMTTDEFIIKSKKVHCDKYDYSETFYGINNNDKINIKCLKHGLFKQTPSNHLSGKGCRICCIPKKSYSKVALNWLNSIQLKENITIQHAENEGEFIIPNTNYKADGYCQETNTIYEFHGDYWHGNPNKFILTEINKTTKCSFGELYQKTLDKELVIINMGFNLITMWESEWNKINKNIDIEEIPQWLWNVSE